MQQERFGRKTTPVEEDEYDTEDGSFVTPPQSPTLVALSQHRELRSSRRTLQISESGSKGKRSIPEQDDQVQFPKYSRTSSGRRSRASTTASTAASTGSFHTFPVPETITGSLAIRSSGSPSRSFPQGISFTSTTKSTIPSFSSSVNQPYPQTQSGNTSFHTELTVPDLAEEVRSSHSFSLASSEENAVIGASSKAEKADQFETFSSGAVSWDSDFRDQVGLALDNFEKSEALPKTEASATLEATGTFARKFPEHHKVRDLPKRGLYCPDFEKAPIKPKIPFFILFECARIALESKLPLDEIISHLPENFKNYHEFWRTMEDKSKTNPIKLPRRNNSTAWIAATSNNGGVSVTGRMSFSSSGTKLFDLSLDALKFDKSCRFQRKFGGDRFFYLLVPGLFNLPTNFTDQHGHLRQRLLEWMTTDILFLGRTWRVFHTEKYKPKATEKNDNNKERKLKQTGYRLVLFATSGSDIPHSLDLSIYQLFDWFMPLRVNRNLMLPYCKAYARLDLGISPCASF